MAIPAWPGTVPYKPRLDGFKVPKPFADPAVNQVEDGTPIMRRWAASNWTKLSYEVVCTKTQSDALFTFFRDTLGHGSSRFTMPVARKGVGGTWPAKTCFITGGSIQGPEPYGGDHHIWKFELNVLDY
jgi:hypothetical protein